MRLKKLGLFLAGVMAATAAPAAIVTGTWAFSVGAYSGTYSFSGLDTSMDYTDSTAGGFSVVTSFGTAGTNKFTYVSALDQLFLGADVIGEGVFTQYFAGSGIYGDWSIWNIANPFSFVGSTSGLFQYGGTASDPHDAFGSATITEVSAVPEPGTLALVGLSLAGLAAVRRQRA